MGMHKSHRLFEEVAEEVLEYMAMVNNLLIGPHCDQHFIINMDQTPIYFLMSPKNMLFSKGQTTIHIRASTNNTELVMVAVTICVDRTTLPSVVVNSCLIISIIPRRPHG